jgi:predicted amidohydrolase
MDTSGGSGMNAPGGGTSAVFGPDGRRLTRALDSTTEGIIYADLDMDQIVSTKIFADATGHYSRPDLMRLNVSKKVRKMVQPDDETATMALE